jgi:hypothetical protein
MSFADFWTHVGKVNLRIPIFSDFRAFGPKFVFLLIFHFFHTYECKLTVFSFKKHRCFHQILGPKPPTRSTICVSWFRNFYRHFAFLL